MIRLLAILAVVGALAGCTSGDGDGDRTGQVPGDRTPTTGTAPALDVQTVVAGLEHGWDVGFLPDGQVLLTERPGRLTLLDQAMPGATATVLEADFGDLGATGEGGLMGLVVHPDFAESRRFTTCQTHWDGASPVDARLVTWELAEDGGSASRLRDPLVGGLPLSPSGRHSGCRPTLAPDGTLLVGTGDAADGRNAQDLHSLGGKVLRFDLATGDPAPGNPFERADDAGQRLIWTYGHRNVQGVAIQPGTGAAYSAEHGPDVEDEVNRLQAGGNYGWDPAQGGTVGGYDESVPMTDLDRFPDAVEAVWNTGDRTEAICAVEFLTGQAWGELDGVLAVTTLKGSKLLLLSVGPEGAVSDVTVPDELDQTYGRLRAARLGPDGALYVTTSNGADDQLLRITPA